MIIGTPIRTVGDLRAALADRHDEDRIQWAYDGPEECCNGHVHDVTEIHGCDAVAAVSPGTVEIMLNGGFP